MGWLLFIIFIVEFGTLVPFSRVTVCLNEGKRVNERKKGGAL